MGFLRCGCFQYSCSIKVRWGVALACVCHMLVEYVTNSNTKSNTSKNSLRSLSYCLTLNNVSFCVIAFTGSTSTK